MPSTAKIVLTIIAFYAVTGIYNFSGSGNFITPFFLNYFFFVIVALYSYARYYSYSGSITLGLYALAIITISSCHSITLTFLNRFIEFSDSTTIKVSDLHKIIAILAFYCLLFYIHMRAKQAYRSNPWFWLPLLFLGGSLIAILLNESVWQASLLSVYFCAFTILSNKQNSNNLQTYNALSFQFILFLVLENIRLLSTNL